MEWLNSQLVSVLTLMPTGMLVLIVLIYRDVRKLRKEMKDRFGG
jgi:hypothetical protein